LPILALEESRDWCVFVPCLPRTWLPCIPCMQHFRKALAAVDGNTACAMLILSILGQYQVNIRSVDVSCLPWSMLHVPNFSCIPKRVSLWPEPGGAIRHRHLSLRFAKETRPEAAHRPCLEHFRYSCCKLCCNFLRLPSFLCFSIC
jgi:hypothetical protein